MGSKNNFRNTENVKYLSVEIGRFVFVLNKALRFKKHTYTDGFWMSNYDGRLQNTIDGAVFEGQNNMENAGIEAEVTAPILQHDSFLCTKSHESQVSKTDALPE